MDGDVGFAAQQRGLEFTREQALAAALLQRPLGLLVARGDDPEQFGLDAELRAQVRRNHLGLGEGQGALARGDDEAGHREKQRRRE